MWNEAENIGFFKTCYSNEELWRAFLSSRMLHCVIGQTVSDVLEDSSVLISRVK
jgi:hypothetical protein